MASKAGSSSSKSGGSKQAAGSAKPGAAQRPAFPQNKPSMTGGISGKGRSNNAAGKAKSK